jgi:hypothetical protein
MIYYHGTSTKFVPAIMRDGLVTKCDGCVGLNTNRLGVYMWGDFYNAFAHAKHNWKKDAAVIIVEIPDEPQHAHRIIDDPEFWSDKAYICLENIHPSYLTAIKLGTSRVLKAVA